MKKNNQNLIIISTGILLLSFIVFYAGQFLFSSKKTDIKGGEQASASSHASVSTGKKQVPVLYNRTSVKLGGHAQEIFTLELDPLDERVEFKPALSYDSIFGFEKLSEICARTGAYAAVNGGFFYEYGEPVGMVAIDGELYTGASGYDTVLIMDDKGAHFEKFTSYLSFSHNGRVTNINMLNRTARDGNIIMYTDNYGSTNRAKLKNTSVRIENGSITAIFEDAQEVLIKKDTYLISFFGKSSSFPQQLGMKTGDTLNVRITPDIKGSYQAYECGSMLVKSGENVAPQKDRWAGTLLNRDPRTAVGIKDNGNIVLAVADGRQPGYSSGLTGSELAEYMIGLGIRDAAMLDGGASSQIFVKGTLRNRPSYRGIERPVAGAFIIKVKEGT